MTPRAPRKTRHPWPRNRQGSGHTFKRLECNSPLPCRPPLPLDGGEELLAHEVRAREHLVESQLRRRLVDGQPLNMAGLAGRPLAPWLLADLLHVGQDVPPFGNLILDHERRAGGIVGQPHTAETTNIVRLAMSSVSSLAKRTAPTMRR
jgi:hypothetical protein